jgi:hypothetical protein
MRSHEVKIGDRNWLFNSIDPEIVCDHQAEVVAALNAGLAGMGMSEMPAGRVAMSYVELSKAMPPTRWSYHRKLILGNALVDRMDAMRALKEEKISPLEANEGVMEGLIFNYSPFSEGAGSFLARLVVGASKESKTSQDAGQSGG